MASGTVTATSTGAISYEASEAVNLSVLTSVSGDQSVTGLEITDNLAGEDKNLVTAGTVTMRAVNGIGTSGESDIDTNIGTLRASTHLGGIYIDETDNLVIDGARVTGGMGSISIRLQTGYATYTDGIGTRAGRFDVEYVEFTVIQEMLQYRYPLSLASRFQPSSALPSMVAMASQQSGYHRPWAVEPVIGAGDLLFRESAWQAELEEEAVLETPYPEVVPRQPAAPEAEQLPMKKVPAEKPGQAPEAPESGRDKQDDRVPGKEKEAGTREPGNPGVEVPEGLSTDSRSENEFDQALNGLSSQQQAALQACRRALAKKAVKTTIGQAYREYMEMCTIRNMNPVGYSLFIKIMSPII